MDVEKQTRQKKTCKIVLLGPPASGKGTQAVRMEDKLGAVQLSSGDILRDEVRKGGEQGSKLKAIMDSGQLVPDELICGLISARILEACQENGFILDGFPRTSSQAVALDRLLADRNVKIDLVISMEIDDDLLVSRCLGRLAHPASGRTYHTEFNPPKVPMTDDVTGEPLVRRSDDNEGTLRKRLLTYHQQTRPVKEYYQRQGILRCIDASKTPNTIWEEINGFLQELT